MNSPSDRASDVLAKVQNWLDAGTSLVWVVDPPIRSVTVFRPGGQSEMLTDKDLLLGEEIVPGFEIVIADIFDD